MSLIHFFTMSCFQSCHMLSWTFIIFTFDILFNIKLGYWLSAMMELNKLFFLKLTPRDSDFSDCWRMVLADPSYCSTFLITFLYELYIFPVWLKSVNQNNRGLVQYHPCSSTGTDINSPPWELINVLTMISYFTFTKQIRD